MFLQFVDRNSTGLAILAAAYLAAIVIVVAIHLSAKVDLAKAKPALPVEEERLFKVLDASGAVVFSHRAHDVDPFSKEGAPTLLNFLGPRLDSDDNRVSVAVYPWKEDMTISSEPVKVEAE